MYQFWVLAVMSLVGGGAQAGDLEYRYQEMLRRNHGGEEGFTLPVTTGIYAQKLDPSRSLKNLIFPDKRTFPQRYFINSSFATGPDSPVFYVMCGEGSCDNGGFFPSVIAQAQKFKARLVALEHRYYGKSRPFEVFSAANLKYLKTEYALADLARFQDYITVQNKWTGPWIVVGGSYSGSLAAYYRLWYPNKVVGALASSGPVEAQASFSDYDQAVADAAGPTCAAAIRAVVKQVEDSFSDPTKLAQMKALFGASDVKDNVDFLYTLADMAAIAVQYGKKDIFCSAVTGVNPLQGYATLGLALFKWFGITPLQDSIQGMVSEKASDYESGVGERQWFWQSCTEFGYFQVANSDPDRTARSALINLDYHYNACKRLFGLKNPVSVTKINREFYQPLQESWHRGASRTFFTNGSTDPWRMLSINSDRGNDKNPLDEYELIDGGSHCSDLDTPILPSITHAQETFEGLLSKWLSP